MYLLNTLKNMKRRYFSFSEVKSRSRKPDGEGFYRLYFFASKFSPYLSWVFVNSGVSANQVTGLFFVVGALSVCSFLSYDATSAFVGVLLWRLHIVLDISDGEVARFTNKFSILGAYWDYMIPATIFPFCMLAIGFALFQNFNQPKFLLLASIGAIGYGLQMAVKNNYYRACKAPENSEDEPRIKNSKKGYGIRDLILYLTSFDAFLLCYLIAMVLEMNETFFFLILGAFISFSYISSVLKFYLLSRYGQYKARV